VSLKRVIAAAFKHLRKERLQKVEFIYYISIDRKWMNKDQAAHLLELAQKEGLIAKSNGTWIPTFDPAGVDIPLGFKPSADIFRKKDTIEQVVEDIAQKTGIDQKSIYAEMNTIIQDCFHGKLRPEAAVTILARRYRVPYGRYTKDLFDQLTKEEHTIET